MLMPYAVDPPLTRAQLAYLAAFDELLTLERSPTDDCERVTARLRMRARLGPVLREAGLSIPRRRARLL
jgi:hypothetical protein